MSNILQLIKNASSDDLSNLAVKLKMAREVHNIISLVVFANGLDIAFQPDHTDETHPLTLGDITRPGTVAISLRLLSVPEPVTFRWHLKFLGEVSIGSVAVGSVSFGSVADVPTDDLFSAVQAELMSRDGNSARFFPENRHIEHVKNVLEELKTYLSDNNLRILNSEDSFYLTTDQVYLGNDSGDEIPEPAKDAIFNSCRLPELTFGGHFSEFFDFMAEPTEN